MPAVVELHSADVPTWTAAVVPVTPASTTTGTTTTLTFRVPNESDSATTTKLTITLPTTTPLISVSVKAVPGWTASITEMTLPSPAVVEGTTITKAPATITWTAQPGNEIGQGQFQEFTIEAGPLPAAGTSLVFPATQTYSDGTVVTWDELQTGSTEPEHPAPSFTVTAASPSDAHAADTTARILAGSGVGLGGAALLLALAALLRRRPATADTTREAAS